MKKVLTIILITAAALALSSCSSQPLTIKGFTYADTNTTDGSYNSNESLLGGVTIESGNISESTQSNGSFSITADVYANDIIKLKFSKSSFKSTIVELYVVQSSSSASVKYEDAEGETVTNLAVGLVAE